MKQTVSSRAWRRVRMIAAILIFATLTSIPVTAHAVGPMFSVDPGAQGVRGADWGGDSMIAVEIDSYPWDGISDFTAYCTTDASGWFDIFTWQYTTPAFDITPYAHVTVSDGLLTKETFVTALVVTPADVNNDVIRGTAAPSSTVIVDVNGFEGITPRRTVTADIAGNWSADFGVLDPANLEDPSGQPCDIAPGTQGSATQTDGDSDQTQVGWRAPAPGYVVDPDSDAIWGHEWTANAEVHITVDDGDPEVSPDFETATTTDEQGDFSISTRDISGYDFAAGAHISVSDGQSTKLHDVTSLAVTDIDTDAETIIGVAPEGTDVHVWIDYTDASLHVIAVDGTWVADFSGGYDLGPGTTGGCSQTDDDGDVTQRQWRVVSPWMGVDPVDDRVWGGDFRGNHVVQISIEDTTTPESPDFVMQAETDPGGNFSRSPGEVSESPVDIAPGMIVTVSDGETVREHEVLAVTITGVDPELDIITGTAPPGEQVQVIVNVDIGGWTSPMRFATADEAGDWTADFSVQQNPDDPWADVFDLDKGQTGWATVYEDTGDGDHTQVHWFLPNPWIGVDPASDTIWGGDFTAGPTVTVTIDDPSNGVGVDFENTYEQGGGGFWASTRDETHDFDITAGMLVTVTDGVNTKDHVVTQLALGVVDKDYDTVSGTAEPGSEVQVYVQTGEDDQPMRFVTADVNGEWVADFSQAVPEYPDTWGRTCDLGPGTQGAALQSETDGDHTQVQWHVADPKIAVQARWDWIDGWMWPSNATVFITVNDPTIPGPSDFTTTVQCDGGGWMGVGTDGFDLRPGMTVTASDGTTSKSLYVADLVVTDTNADDDIVSGTADVSSRLVVSVNDWEFEQPRREVMADEAGSWFADFSAPAGEEEWERAFDLLPGIDGNAYQEDVDGDQTQVYWRIGVPWIWAEVDRGTIGADAFRPNTELHFTVDCASTPESPDLESFIWSDDAGWAHWENAGDITADCTVRVTDGTTTKTLEVTPLTLNGVDHRTDEVSGTAAPLSEVVLWCGGYWGDPVIADAEGDWSMDYSVLTDPVIDIRPGDMGGAIQADDDGDQTQVYWRVNDPWLQAYPAGEMVYGHDWVPGSLVTVNIDDPVGEDMTTVVIAGEDGFVDLGVAPFDVQAGQTVTMTDGVFTKVHLVTSLTVTRVDAETDVLSGGADDGARVYCEVWDDHRYREVTADTEGWLVDFTQATGEEWDQQPLDLQKRMAGRVWERDDDGDTTAVDWRVFDTRFAAELTDDLVEGWDWTPGGQVRVTIDFLDSGMTQYVSDWFAVDSDGYFRIEGLPDISVGDAITVTDGDVTKTLVAYDLTLDGVDRAAGLVWGTSPPHATLMGWIDGAGGGEMYSDARGNWIIDCEQPLTYGQTGFIGHSDEDGDDTRVAWRVNSAELHVDPREDTVMGNDWPEGAAVHLAIDDPVTPASPDWETTLTATGGGFATGRIGAEIDIVGGMVVTGTCDGYEKTHTVTHLMVTDVDSSEDTVRGTAEPYTVVTVWLGTSDDLGVRERPVQADAIGEWLVDFGESVGPEPRHAAYDMQPGDGGAADQPDDDYDYTRVQWHAAAPAITVHSDVDDIAAVDFAPSRTLMITVDRPPLDATPEYTTTRTTNVFGELDEGPLGFDVEAGDVVSVTDGTSEKTLEVSVLGVSSADAENDVVTGIASPSGNAEVTVDRTHYIRWPAVSAAGTWSAEFSVTAGDAPQDGPYDITPGTVGHVFEHDGDGDRTGVAWRAPARPVARNDEYGVTEDTTLSAAAPGLLGNDDHEDGYVAIALVSGPTHGTLFLDGDTGGFTYRPSPDYHGMDSFIYRVADGPLTSAIAVVAITVESVADAPVSQPDSYITDEETTLTVGAAEGVLSNDSDGDGDPLSASIVTTANHGSIDLAADGSFVYVPDHDWNGTDTFTYRADDGELESAVATVSITVNPVREITGLQLGSASRTLAAYGESFGVAGTLTAQGLPLPGARVVLQTSASANGPFSDSITATTTQGGTFSLTHRPSDKTYYRVHFAQESEYEACDSAVIYALPRAWVGTPNAPSTMYVGKAKNVYGYLKPRHTSGTYPVRIYKYRYVSGKWKSYGYVKAKASNYSSYSKYTGSVKLSYKGRWRLRAYHPADSKHAAAWSAKYDYVTVK